MSDAAKKDIKSLLPEELSAQFAQRNLPPFRAKQVFQWLSRGARSFEEMSNLPKPLRDALAGEYRISSLRLLSRQVSAQDGTIKFLWALPDGESVETVFMRYKHGNTVCISTQVGCRMGCAFCASTLGGLVRCLEPGEILSEVLQSQEEAGEKISNIVLMGIGEPLDNYDNVLRFLRLVNHPQGLGIGMRHISLSTCGIVENIDRLAQENLQLTLSVSLHAPDDESRSQIMPINRKYGVDAVFAACDRYFETTGRRISFEYAMVKNLSDREDQARLLVKRLKGKGAHINIIRLNAVSERDLIPSEEQQIKRFVEILTDGGLTVTLRRRLGSDIDAACGQLRRKKMKIT